jgi:hypothetical protein
VKAGTFAHGQFSKARSGPKSWQSAPAGLEDSIARSDRNV